MMTYTFLGLHVKFSQIKIILQVCLNPYLCTRDWLAPG